MNKRLHELDSLRGLASLTVMFSHLALVFPLVWNTSQPEDAPFWMKITFFSPLRVAWAGHEAVIFFFVLSGFVLSLPLWKKDNPTAGYPAYLAKRVLRIYPPYLVSVGIALAACSLWGGREVAGVSAWFNQSWQRPITASAIFDHILMISSFRNCEYNPILWSLVHEMRISIVFPLVIWALRKRERIIWVLPFVFSTADWLSVSLRYRKAFDFDHDYFNTLHYMGFFIVGALLAKYSDPLIQLVRSLSRASKVCMGIIAGVVYTNAFWLPFCLRGIFGPLGKFAAKTWTQEWITCIGVLAFITIALSIGRVSRFLGSRVLLFFGAVSYSLYLFHAVVLKSILAIYAERLPLLPLLFCTALISVLFAWIGWKYIELPSIDLGRWLAVKLAERTEPIRRGRP